MRTSRPTRFSRFAPSRTLPFLLVGIATLAAPIARATTVTLPAAASIQGLSPFYSDVRIFNTSYDTAVHITAAYYCFLGACPGAPPQITIDLAARDSQAFNDIVADAFGHPDTAGGIEFIFDGPQDLIIVTSRLYSTEPTPTVGMFIPGLDPSQAHLLSALTSVLSGGSGAGFRTNVGVYNPNDSPAEVSFSLFSNHAPVGGLIHRSVGPHSGVQVNGVFGEAGAVDENVDNGLILVQSDVPVFSYAAVIDNNTSDPYLVLGAPDRPLITTPSPTGTPEHAPTRTGSPTPSRTPRLTMTPSTSASPTITPASASPLIRGAAASSPGRRPRPASAAYAEPQRDAGFLGDGERYLAILRPRGASGGW